MIPGRLTQDEVWEVLGQIQDPEIPVISLVEMGIIRQVDLDGEHATITIAPTFSGCPALQVIQQDIREILQRAGFNSVVVRLSYSPAWTTEWITEEGREKLKAFGIAPPVHHSGLIELALVLPAPCPYCGSTNTNVKNEFGATQCRSISFCNQCQQPFEQFKPI